VSGVVVIVEHVEQLLDVYASNPNYNSRAAFLLADDITELIFKTYLKAWREKNPGVMAEPDNFPQAAILTAVTWSAKAALVPGEIKTRWEALEPTTHQRWRGQHLARIQNTADYSTIRSRWPQGIECIETALRLHQERNQLYHDPSHMRLAPAESAVCEAIHNVLTLGRILFTRRFESLLRLQPLGRALFAWFYLHKHRYGNDQVRKSLEDCFQRLPSYGHEKLKRFNQEQTGWVFVRDPEFGHGWMLLHHESTTYAKALEDAAISHGLIKKLLR
jgi:hypothetical protein